MLYYICGKYTHNMFTKGQLFFAGFFVIAFVLVMIWNSEVVHKQKTKK